MASRHVVIVCPERWSEETVRILAHRLATSELPECVGVYVSATESGVTVTDYVLRAVTEDD